MLKFLKSPFKQNIGHYVDGRICKIVHGRLGHGFADSFENNIVVNVPHGEVNKRISGQELTYNGKTGKIKFSANQIAVNRPVEDRWIVCHFNSQMHTFDYRTPLDEQTPIEDGGTIYTVIDGHGGHACAHAINLMHSDYLISGLLSPESCEKACNFIRNIQEAQSTHSICKLAKTLWSDPEAVLTQPSKQIDFVPGLDYSTRIQQHDSNVLSNRIKWSAWGPWGPLSSSVWDVHTKNLGKFLEEILSTSFESGACA